MLGLLCRGFYTAVTLNVPLRQMRAVNTVEALTTATAQRRQKTACACAKAKNATLRWRILHLAFRFYLVMSLPGYRECAVDATTSHRLEHQIRSQIQPPTT